MRETPVILVVDDDPLVVGIVERKLRAQGYTVETANDGRAGLYRVRALRPDLIVLDIMMPVLDGRTVLSELQADPVLAKIPVIMLTARRLEGDILDTLKLGASDFITKPFSPDELAARVARLLRSTIATS
jgi:DNA-binding response OmpR family regulator